MDEIMKQKCLFLANSAKKNQILPLSNSLIVISCSDFIHTSTSTGTSMRIVVFLSRGFMLQTFQMELT